MAARLEEMMAGLIKVMMILMGVLVVMVEMMMAGLIKMKYLISSQKMMIGQGDIQNLNLKMIFPPGCPTASLCPLLSLQGRRLPWEGVLMLFLRYLNNNKINNYLGKVR